MPEGDVSVPISPGSGHNIRTIMVTQWVIDPITGIGAWTDVKMQVLILADKRGDIINNESLSGEILAELRSIRQIMEELSIRIS